MKRVLRYCSGTFSHGLVLGGLDSTLPVLVGYSDSDWAGDLDTRKSRTGYVFLLNDGCITWQSKKQPTVALSTSEAEYMSLSSATQELRWLIQFLGELGFQKSPVLLHQDNQGCIQMAKGFAQHSRSKHIDIRHKHIEQSIADGLLTVPYIPTRDMLADLLTKPLNAPRFMDLRDRLQIISHDQFQLLASSSFHICKEADDSNIQRQSKEAVGYALTSFLLARSIFR